MNFSSFDYLIIGAGIVGLTIAKELKYKNPKSKILVLEKERKVGLHSSGNNSGVLHSGIYYPPDSLKAKFCKQGSVEMMRYCSDYNLPINRIGKILLPTKQEDISQLDLLESRAKKNGVEVTRLDKKNLINIEPEINPSIGQALFVPSTSVADSKSVIESILNNCKNVGIKIFYSAVISSIRVNDKSIILKDGTKINYGYLVNTAGLHADEVAHSFQVGLRYTLLPFKGVYWKLSKESGIKVNHLIYPVPDLSVPFLGIHTTTGIDGNIYLGPTAFPAFGRENYHGLDGISFSDLKRILMILVKQFSSGQDGFRSLVWQEGGRYFKPCFANAVRQLLPNVKNKYLLRSNKVGIRAQMFDTVKNKFVNDFLVENGKSSTHILNAISPAWTCAFPFARYIVDNYVDN